jgi:hypothetical protein
VPLLLARQVADPLADLDKIRSGARCSGCDVGIQFGDNLLRCSVLLSRNVNPITEHELYLKLFLTNGGGW